MTHGDLVLFISELDPNLTSDERINAVVAQFGLIDGDLKKNVADMEKALMEKIGYVKEADGDPRKIMRQYNSSMIKQAIAEAELKIEFQRTNHERKQNRIFYTDRFAGVMNKLYGFEPEMDRFLDMTLQEKAQYYVSKLEAAYAKFPRVNAPDVTDDEIMRNYSTILELYNLTYELDNAKEAVLSLDNGEELFKRYSVMQSNLAIINGRAFLMASPYYPELDYGQIMSAGMNFDIQQELSDVANNLDSYSMKPDFNMLDTLQGNLKMFRLEEVRKLEAGGTAEYFTAGGVKLKAGKQDNYIAWGTPLLAKITDLEGNTTVKSILPVSPFAAGIKEVPAEQCLAEIREIDRRVVDDLSQRMIKSTSSIRGSSEVYQNLQAAYERVFLQNHSGAAATNSTQNLLCNKDAIEELLEAADAYLQFKSQARAGTDTVADYSKLGKNAYEQEHINTALQMRKFAQDRVNIIDLLMQDDKFKDLAAETEASLLNGPENDLKRNIAELRATGAQRNQDTWAVREGGEAVAQLHHAVGRDLRRLSELACLERPLTAQENAEIRTRMARAVSLDLIRSERTTSNTEEMGTLERTAAQNPGKFTAGIAGSKQFQKLTDKMTPEKLKEMLSGNGIQNIRQAMLNQAASLSGKAKAPTVEAVPQPPTKSGPNI